LRTCRGAPSRGAGQQRAPDAQAKIVDARGKGHAIAVGDADVVVVAVPAAAAHGTAALVAAALGPGCRIGRGALVAVVVAIGEPGPDVALHIVKAERIGLERADRRRLLAVPAAAAVDAVGVVGADRVAPEIDRGRAGAGGIFPLGL